MHWYLWHLGTPDRDMVAPFFDELVRRYPDAPTSLPEGARDYAATYGHLVVCWLEMAATAELIGRARAVAFAQAQHTYRWIYRTVVHDWEALATLYKRHGSAPIQSAPELLAENARAKANGHARNGAAKVNGGSQKTSAAGRRSGPPRSRHTAQARGGRSAG